jgi:hypothetical protein
MSVHFGIVQVGHLKTELTCYSNSPNEAPKADRWQHNYDKLVHKLTHIFNKLSHSLL